MAIESHSITADGALIRNGRRARLSAAMALDVVRIFDAVLMMAAGGLAVRLAPRDVDAAAAEPIHPWLMAAVVILAVWSLSVAGVYRPELVTCVSAKLRRIVVALASTGLLLSLLAASASGTMAIPPLGLDLWLVASAALVTTSHVLLTAVARSRAWGAAFAETVIVVGPAPTAAAAVERLRRHGSGPLTVLGVFEDRRGGASRPRADIPRLGSVADMVAYVQAHRVDHVVLAVPWSLRHRLLAYMETLKGLAVNVHCALDLGNGDLGYRGVAQLGGLPLLRLADSPIAGWRGVAKAVEDYGLVLLVLPLVLPLIGLVALAIRIEGPGPALFRQPRHGFNNSVFEVYKFRTMRWESCDLGGARQTTQNDPRVTRVGAVLRRTSLDEVPQVFNILRGDMSLVGPRAHPVGMRTEERLCHEIVADYAHRHRMKPGITGWAQINGSRGAVERPEQLRRRVELDLQYIDSWSISLDLRILLHTILTVLWQKNAY